MYERTNPPVLIDGQDSPQKLSGFYREVSDIV